MDYKLLGKNIARLRQQNNMTQEVLAEKIDVSTVFISQMETSVRNPSLETILKLAETFDTTVETLVGSNSPQAKYNEIIHILKDRTPTELTFITNIIREICSNLNDDKIVLK